MRRLEDYEETALLYLQERAPYAPGIWVDPATKDVCAILDGLVKKGRVHRLDDEDGPVYTLRKRGEWEAACILSERANA